MFGERDIITDSDQGRSFRAFWSSAFQSPSGGTLRPAGCAMALPAVEALKPDGRLRRVHYDWLEAGENTQRTVAQLSEQLRRFLDDQSCWKTAALWTFCAASNETLCRCERSADRNDHGAG